MGGRAERPSALVMLDLDGFKDVNDTMGHSLSDQVLREMADRLAAAAPSGVTVYRFGGDDRSTVPPGGSAHHAQCECGHRVCSARRARSGRFERERGSLSLRSQSSGQTHLPVVHAVDEDIRAGAARYGQGTDVPPKTVSSCCIFSRKSACWTASSPARRRCCAGNTR